jgi:uncharacterized OB-fold protein
VSAVFHAIGAVMDEDWIEVSPLHQYRAALERGVLAYQQSRTDGRAVFYPRIGPDLGWCESAGTGTVHAVTVVSSKEGNYNVALVDCDEGFRLMTRIDGIAPDQVTIGMRVGFRPGRLDDGTPIPVFVPLDTD